MFVWETSLTVHDNKQASGGNQDRTTELFHTNTCESR